MLKPDSRFFLKFRFGLLVRWVEGICSPRSTFLSNSYLVIFSFSSLTSSLWGFISGVSSLASSLSSCNLSCILVNAWLGSAPSTSTKGRVSKGDDETASTAVVSGQVESCVTTKADIRKQATIDPLYHSSRRKRIAEKSPEEALNEKSLRTLTKAGKRIDRDGEMNTLQKKKLKELEFTMTISFLRSLLNATFDFSYVSLSKIKFNHASLKRMFVIHRKSETAL